MRKILDVSKNPEAAIYDGGEKVEGVVLLKIAVEETAKTCQQPLENGQQISDHKVRNPNKLTVSVVTVSEKHSAVYKKLKAMLTRKVDLKKLASVSAKIGTTFGDLVMTSLPHVEDAEEHFDRYFFDIGFEELIIVKMNSTDKESASNPENAAEVSVGQCPQG